MIRIIVSVAVLVLFGFTLDNHPIVDPPHWNPSWPMYENGTYEKCRIGYGDWCVVEEGPHHNGNYTPLSENIYGTRTLVSFDC